jgi:hypothetical protein
MIGRAICLGRRGVQGAARAACGEHHLRR